MYLDPTPSSLRPVAEILSGLAVDLARPGSRPHDEALRSVLTRLRTYVPGALVASIARVKPGKPDEPLATIAASDELAAEADRLQAAADEGPVLAALAGAPVAACGAELAHRWPEAGQRLTELGISGVLAMPLPGLPGEAVLTLYADSPIGPSAVTPAAEAAAVAAVAVLALAVQERAANLEIALNSSRQIAAAVGIVMASERCSYEHAFARIRRVSQRMHRKMRDLADDILLTGALPELDGVASPNG